MNMSETNKDKNKVAPLLVQLYDSHRVYDMAKGDSEALGGLATAVTELISSDISDSENEIIADILISMVDKAEQDLKLAIADKISKLPNAPTRLVIHMTNDEISVAEKVLQHSPVLCDMDLMYVIQSRSSEYCDAIAKREAIGGAVMTALAETRYVSTIKTLLDNNNIILNEAVISTATDMCADEDGLVKPLLARKETTEAFVKKVYEIVGDELKAFVLENYEDEIKDRKPEIELIFDEVVGAATSDVVEPEDASVSIIRSAELMKKNGLLNADLLISMLKKSEMSSFVVYFASFCDLPNETMKAILKQKNGKGLAICCKANDVLKTDFVSLYLMTQSLRDKGKMIDQKLMHDSMDYFDRLDIEKAKKILKASQLPKNSYVIDM